MKDVIAGTVLLLGVAALVLVIFGEALVNRLHSVKRLRAARSHCEAWVVSVKAGGRPVGEMCEMRFEEVSAPPVPAAAPPEEQLRHLRFGDVAVIVHYKERHLHHSTKEVRFYAAATVVSLLIAGLLNLTSTHTLWELLQKLAENHLVPILEFAMIFLWLIRLVSEIRSIDSLLDH